MMIFSLVAMIGLEKCCITSACLQWLCHSGERIVARGPLVFFFFFFVFLNFLSRKYFKMLSAEILPSMQSVNGFRYMLTLGDNIFEQEDTSQLLTFYTLLAN